MQVGVTNMIMGDVPLASFFDQATEAGYEVVELAICREGELTPDTPTTDLKRICSEAHDAGLEIVSLVHLHTNGNIQQSGAAQRIAVSDTIAGLRIADVMDVRCTLRTLDPQSPDVFYDEAYRNAVEALQQIGQAGDKLNVDVAIEFVWNGFLFSPMEMRRFLDDVGHRRIGFYYDPGNVAVFQSPHHWVRIVGPHLKMVHLKDWQGGPLDGCWPPLLEGQVDFAAQNRELRAIGYDGPMISEVSTEVASLNHTAEAIRKIIAM